MDLVKREIVDLKMKSCSYNEIVDHFKNTVGLKISRNFISDVIMEAGQRARHLNGIYDSKVRARFRVIEVDETFQGRGACYLGVVDKASHYLLSLARLPSRNLESFKQVLEPLANRLSKVELVITDGYPGYKNLIPEIFEGIAHLFCHVHAHRVFLKELDPLHSKARKAYSALKKQKEKLAEVKHELKKKKRCLKRDEKRLERVTRERDAYYQQQGIKKYSKKAA
jgi:transposase